MKKRRKKFPTLYAVIAAVAIIISATIGGSLAWITDESNELINTFTYGDINITLTETDTGLDNDNNEKTNTYKMVPGNTITKDPKVTVKAGSEASWLFVKLVKSTKPDFDYFMTYEMADDWTQLVDANGNAVAGVYYRKVEALTASDATDKSFAVIKDNKVTVKENVTKTDLTGLGENYPTLEIFAYAVQQDNIADATTAWDAIGN